MQLQLNSCADDLDLPICNQSSSNLCKGSGSSRPPAERSSSCGAGPSSRVSVRNSDLMMITSASRENSATMAGACTNIGSWSNPNADLINDSLHAAMSRQDDSSLSSRQSRMIFSSTSGAAADHERGGWSPRCYACSFCGREFNSAQALGGHMNIHRRDRARLRTSTSPASIPHDQAELPPILQNTNQYSAHSSLYEPFNEAAFRGLENPITAISSSLNVDTYTTPHIIDFSATPTFSLLDKQPAPPDPTLQALAACPSISPDENLPAPFSVPLVDLLPFGSTGNSTSAIRFSNEAHSLFSNIAPHASPLFVRPSLENSSLKHVEALSMCAGQASASPDHCEAASDRAQLIQFSHSKGRNKRAREDDAVDGATANSTAGQRCRHKRSSAEKSNPLHAARPFVRPGTPDVKGLLCLDLELRLGQSSLSDCDGAGACCCRPWTTATAAPRPPA